MGDWELTEVVLCKNGDSEKVIRRKSRNYAAADENEKYKCPDHIEPQTKKTLKIHPGRNVNIL